ncbi:hypothetical protein R1sor_012319 [Riccia sorocarpa]|uniref:Uncharacterized protein n=1 Tax=Riccia sorocarpa TaxID=122646 RepID=A0ABD3I3T3_9MARC
MMLADAIHGRKFDNDGIEYNTEEEPEPNTEPAVPNPEAADVKPDPDELMADDKKDQKTDEIMRTTTTAETGYPLLKRRPKKQAPKFQLNERDIP